MVYFGTYKHYTDNRYRPIINREEKLSFWCIVFLPKWILPVKKYARNRSLETDFKKTLTYPCRALSLWKAFSQRKSVRYFVYFLKIITKTCKPYIVKIELSHRTAIPMFGNRTSVALLTTFNLSYKTALLLSERQSPIDLDYALR